MSMRTSPGGEISGAGALVRTDKVRAPSECSGMIIVGEAFAGGEIGVGFGAGGIRGMNVPGEKEGERIRRYQPRMGR